MDHYSCPIDFRRRNFLRRGFFGISTFIYGHFLINSPIALATSGDAARRLGDIGPLTDPDRNGIRLPHGFKSRVIAESGQPLFDYQWHAAPDGGACFTTDDGGWIYVSNSEMNKAQGGAGALRFDARGDIVEAYSVLTGTSRNCAGGTTPWNTWLSCEEVRYGQVWECDPYGIHPAVVRPALGRFNHEAVAVDVRNGQLYLTEDQGDGCLYRFTPAGRVSDRLTLDEGRMEVAEVLSGNRIRWHLLPDPQAIQQETRYQVKEATVFNGGEGIWYHQGVVYFTTKGDDRVWAYETDKQLLDIIYNASLQVSPQLKGVDNVTVSDQGDVLVAEDGGNMEIVIITRERKVLPLLQVMGQDRSEITGPAFSPDGTRLYFSSQRGRSGRSSDGITYEIIGF